MPRDWQSHIGGDPTLANSPPIQVLYKEWPWTRQVVVIEGCNTSWAHHISRMNFRHTREEVAAWVATIEPPETPEQVVEEPVGQEVAA